MSQRPEYLESPFSASYLYPPDHYQVDDKLLPNSQIDPWTRSPVIYTYPLLNCSGALP